VIDLLQFIFELGQNNMIKFKKKKIVTLECFAGGIIYEKKKEENYMSVIMSEQELQRLAVRYGMSKDAAESCPVENLQSFIESRKVKKDTFPTKRGAKPVTHALVSTTAASVGTSATAHPSMTHTTTTAAASITTTAATTTITTTASDVAAANAVTISNPFLRYDAVQHKYRQDERIHSLLAGSNIIEIIDRVQELQPRALVKFHAVNALSKLSNNLFDDEERELYAEHVSQSTQDGEDSGSSGGGGDGDGSSGEDIMQLMARHQWNLAAALLSLYREREQTMASFGQLSEKMARIVHIKQECLIDFFRNEEAKTQDVWRLFFNVEPQKFEE